MFIDSFQEKIWQDKYQYKNETFDKYCERIAYNVFPAGEKDMRKKLLKYLKEFEVLFGGRVNSNIGTNEKGVTLFNCFISPSVCDPDSLEGILELLFNYAITLKTEGGVGFCANFFRPTNTLIRKIGVTTPGPIKFLELFDKASEIITSGNVNGETSYQGKPTKKSIRKGATMVTMSVSHPDIEDFITAKATPNRLTKINMSVLVTDAFIYAVENDLDWDLWFPDINFERYEKEWSGDFEKWAARGYPCVVYKTVKAVDLWDLLLKNSYLRSEPGILFIDNTRKMDNLHYLEDCSISATNPCQPNWAPVLTPKGISTIKKINVCDIIWSEDGWVTVTKKESNGIKEVYKYKTTANVFYGTCKHKIKSNGKKIEVGKADSIDILLGDPKNINEINSQAIMDGLLIGDGSVHKASNNLIHLYIGNDDYDYHKSEIKHLIGRHRPGIAEKVWEVTTSLISDDLPLTFDRKIPNKYKFADRMIVASFLRGLFSANGNVLLKGQRVVLKATSLRLVEDVQLMLSSLGIKSYITINKSKKILFNNGEYESKENYGLNITKETLGFEKLIGFIQEYKTNILKQINNSELSNRNKTTFDINSVEYVSTEEVFNITVNGKNHTYWSGGCNVSNCGEVPGSTGKVIYNNKECLLGDVCNLGSINLTKFYNIESKQFDYEGFLNDVEILIRGLDNIIEISNYPLSMYEDAAKLKRKIGMGVLGIGSLMMMMNIKYGSDKCVIFLDNLLNKMMNKAYQVSALMAKELGPFALYNDKLLSGGYVKNSGVLTDETIEMIKEYGLRHSALSAIAPCGTMSIVAGNISGGLEPVFAKEFTRWNRVEGKKTDFKYPDVHKGEWFETDNFKEQKIGDEVVLMSKDKKYRIDKNSGLCEQVTIRDYGYNIALRNGFEETSCAMELSIEEHLNVLKVVASNVDQSVSKTINIPNETSFEDFKKLYGKIHLLGIKGCTTYREGTSIAVLETEKNRKKKDIKKQQKEFIAAFKNQDNDFIVQDVQLPEEYPATGHILMSEGKKWYVHVAFKDKARKKPFAIFVNTNNKEDNVLTFDALDKLEELAVSFGLNNGKIEEAKRKYAYQKNPVKICRMLGLLLRHNINVLSIVKALDSVEQATPGTFVFRIKKFLCQFVDEIFEPVVCPECGEKALVFSEGCFKCNQCGNSKCG